MSELSEDKLDNIETKYKTGERVTAKVLKVLFIYYGCENSYSWTVVFFFYLFIICAIF